MAESEGVFYINSKGVKYYFHQKVVTLSGQEKTIYYAATSRGEDAMDTLSEGMEIKENAETGLPYLVNLPQNSNDPFPSIFSVVGCDMDWTNKENKDCCAYRLDFREYSANVINQKGAVYTVESEFGESYTGTKEELIEIHNDEGGIFYDMDIIQEMYVFQGETINEYEWEIVDEPTDIYWRNEFEFDNYEEAEKYFKEDLENAKSNY